MTDTGGLEKVLQATLDRLVESRLGSLRQELSRELQGEIAAALGGRKDGASAPGGTPASPAMAELNQAIASILRPTGQTEVMGALLSGAGAFAGRAALLVKKSEALAFWRAVRFSDEASNAMRTVTIPTSHPGIVKEMSDTLQAISRPRAPGLLPSAWEGAVGDCADGNLHFFPVVVQGRLVAALYADSGSVAGSVERSALEILAKVTGLSLETAAGRVSAGASRTAAADAVPAKATAPEAAPPPLHAPAPVDTSAPPPGSFAASIPSAPEMAPSIAPPPSPETLPEEDRQAHSKAHRFARVAVQDLLSYHKNKIEQARKSKNLYGVLKDDIDKTRENYRQRFGKTAARSFDYFHYELVLKLAANDPTALGPQYPGASEEG